MLSPHGGQAEDTWRHRDGSFVRSPLSPKTKFAEAELRKKYGHWAPRFRLIFDN